LLESTKVNTFFEFTKGNEKIFKKKLFLFVNSPRAGQLQHKAHFISDLTRDTYQKR